MSVSTSSLPTEPEAAAAIYYRLVEEGRPETISRRLLENAGGATLQAGCAVPHAFPFAPHSWLDDVVEARADLSFHPPVNDEANMLFMT
jgi:hypothetical protein